MADLNRVSLLGRLGADPEIRSTQSGEKVASLRVATGEKWKDKNSGEDKERTEWHSIVIWGPLAGIAERFLRKGARCLIEGTLRTRKWQDQEGKDRWSTEVVLSGFNARLDVIDWPEGQGGASKGQEDSYGSGQLPPGPDRGMDDEIPF